MIYTEAGDPDNAFCRSDNSDVLDTTPWIRVPYPGQWGAPTFKCVYNHNAAAMLGLAARGVFLSPHQRARLRLGFPKAQRRFYRDAKLPSRLAL